MRRTHGVVGGGPRFWRVSDGGKFRLLHERVSERRGAIDGGDGPG